MQRIAFEIPKQENDKLEKLARESGLSLLGFFQNASAMFEWALKELKNGRTIASIDEENASYTEVTMPCFEAIKKS